MNRLLAIANLHPLFQCDQRRDIGAGAAPDIRGELADGTPFACVDVVPVGFGEQEYANPHLPDLARHDPAPPITGMSGRSGQHRIICHYVVHISTWPNGLRE
ncbi:hypothetical protein L0Z22_01355 [Burkholderia cepacia]|nr:hypothetical protein [Burkholderia cepacia]UQO34428.1 hypothetical protein L0Z22_01355 [Burkholderia cepacia]UQO47922.1 hypothetical protein L0Z05_03155 [Burkholderia cepacia]UQP09826.1 hypothetical protein L0Z01_16900 [Burkholderia cepacia]